MKSIWAKIFGWSQFAVQAAGQIAGQTVPGEKTWQTVLRLIGSGAVAVAVHAASSTDGTK